MDQLFQQIMDGNFAEAGGLTVNASITLSELLLNELIDLSLQGNQSITQCRVSIGEQNRIEVTLHTPLWPWPVHLSLQLFHSIDLSRSPTMRAFLENHVLLGKLGSFLKVLPEGIRIYEDQLSVDLGAFVRDPQHKRILALVRSIEIHSEKGQLTLDIRVER